MGTVKNIALLLSGGTGTRLGSDIPKQYMEAGGRPVISYSIGCLAAHERIDGIQIVAEPVWEEKIEKWVEEAGASRLPMYRPYSFRPASI